MNPDSTLRYLSFSLGTEEYAVPLLTVREVIAVPEITPVPSAPVHFLGIMNLRGQVISIVDLRLKLGIKSSKSAETSVIICDLEEIVIGIVVDSINSVLSPKQEEISIKPEIQNNRNTSYITSVYQNGQKLVLILDVKKALGMEDLKPSLQGTSAKAATRAA